MKPSDFKIYPWSSLEGNAEAETIAQNIMKVLARTGDEWRRLPWAEYEAARIADGETALNVAREGPWFEDVIDYTISEHNARAFSPWWAAVGQTAEQ